MPILHRMSNTSQAERTHTLTPRERELVELLAAGFSGVEIGRELCVTPETVRTHLRNAMRRTGARTRAQLVAAAAANGEISLSSSEPVVPPQPRAASSVAAQRSASPAEMIEHVLETAREMLGMQMAFVSDTRAGLQDFVALAGDSDSFGASLDGPVPMEGTYCKLMLAGRLDNSVPDASAEPLVAALPITAEMDVGAYIGVPVVLSDGSVFGSFCCLSHEAETLQVRDAQFMRVLARLIADLIERDANEARARDALARADRVDVLLSALAARDGYTQEHSRAVVELAVAIGRRLGLDDEELASVETVAQLHDIGKIGIPDEILGKPGRLTESEWAVMHEHPEIGERIVLSVPTLAHLARAVRAEHERWDGGGYPDRLAGESIPVASRIVLVADAYHAMTSDRPYRRAMGRAAALDELRRNAGSQFWPAAVDAAVAALA
jgi:DNA-binding CsgD family transcriptional regulator